MTVTETGRTRTRTMRVPRSRGAVSGLLLVLLGAWGALIPFIGPYLDYSWGTTQHWHWTPVRGWLEVLPGGVAALGGLLILVSVHRVRGSLGGWLAALAGAWLVVGQTLAKPFHLGDLGQPVSTSDRGRAAAELGYFYGLGAVILFLAAFALGRLAVVGLRDLRAAERDDQLAAEQARQEEELARRQAAERDAAVATGGASEEERRRAEAAAAEEHARAGAADREQQARADAADREQQVRGDSADRERQARAEAAATEERARAGAADREQQARGGAAEREQQARADAADQQARTEEIRRGDPRYEPDRPYGSPDEPTTRYDTGGVGSDYGDGRGDRPPTHQAPDGG